MTLTSAGEVFLTHARIIAQYLSWDEGSLRLFEFAKVLDVPLSRKTRRASY